jgi:hypothetical protein
VRAGIGNVCARFAGTVVVLALTVSVAHAGYDYPARPYLEAYLARATEQFPGDVPRQRCWAATNAIQQYALEHFGPDHAEAWMAPWWDGERWRQLCDGKGLSASASRHWGITCPYRSCPEGEGPYISINHERIYSGTRPESWMHSRYYYVMAHEMAHAIGFYYGHPKWADDHWADAVARALGAAVCSHSPYCRRGPPYARFGPQETAENLVVPPLAPLGTR